MPGGRRKASGRKARRRRDNDYALESIDIETTIADKCMYGPHEQDHCMAFAEEEAELVPASMIDTLQYKQARLSGRKRGIIETDRPLFPLILPTKESLAPSTGTSPSPEDEAIPTKTVIIIGAGLSGAAAASQLTRWGYNVVILEGRNRPGGRVHTARLESKSHPGVAAVADLGGAVIQGVDGNPMAVISHQLGIPMSAVGSECRIDVEGLAKGKRCGDIDRKIMYLHDRLLDECVEHAKNLGPVSSIISVGSAYEALWRDGEDWESRYDEYKLKRQEEDEEEEDKEEKEEGETITDPRERLKIAKQLINWKIAHDEFAAAATMRSVSLTGWNIDDKYEITGHHAFLPGGNIRLVQGLLKDVPVLYGTEVKKVEQSKECVLVTTAGGQTFKADSCLVTVPLGVLKKGLITFQPPLPQEKQVSIKKLGFGLLNKLCLLFPHAFWNDKDDQFGYAVRDPSERGRFYYFFQYAGISGGAVLAALVAGDAAIKFETDTKEESLARVMTILRQIWEPKLGKGKVPNPIQAACTRWSSDPFSCGSYSSAALGSSVSDFDELAKPFDRLFFAGEATTSKWPATMHGALFTGFREASRIARYLGNNPLLLDLKTIPVVDRDGEESDDEGGNNNDDAPSDAVAVNSDDIEDEDEEVAGDGERLLKLSQDLKEMVASREPDLLFGCFSAYFAPTSPDPASTPAPLLPSGDVAGPSPASRTDTETTQPASSTDDGLCLVRVDLALSLGGCDGEREDDSSVPVFLAISKSDVYNLQDIKGDSERLLVLRNPLGLGINLEKRSGSLSDSALVKAREQVGRGKTIKRTRPAVLRLLLDLILKSPMSQISQE